MAIWGWWGEQHTPEGDKAIPEVVVHFKAKMTQMASCHIRSI